MRDEPAAKRFLTKAIRRPGVPEKITIEGSAAQKAAMTSYNEEHGTAIEIRQIKSRNNIGEQDHRGVKRIPWPMLGCKAFDAAHATLVGIALMHMMNKAPCGRTFQPQPRYQEPARWAVTAYVPRLITSPSS
jgi:transposase-like protein